MKNPYEKSYIYYEFLVFRVYDIFGGWVGLTVRG